MVNVTDSLSNLFELYNLIGSKSEISTLTDFDSFKILSTKNSVWPNVIFGVNGSQYDQQLLPEISKQAGALNSRPVLVGAFLPEFIKELRTNYYLPVDQWVSMQKDLSVEVPAKDYAKDIRCEILDSRDLDLWVNIVNDCLFNSRDLNPLVFKNLLEEKSVVFVGARFKEELVGTTLVILDKFDRAGLYMVCVQKAQRGLGVGAALIDFVFNELKSRNINCCVLQSTSDGLKLYEKMGFDKGERITLYWKVK